MAIRAPDGANKISVIFGNFFVNSRVVKSMKLALVDVP